ncbi:MAG: 2-hydroxyglutaryl-CoA dehydratase [Deltaproteobacteria bacterium]|nr:2-hydroxyglutaryl-CoA dehydratase [Deltaproteobacteria bacterium]MBW2053211.1 2-hydroxyglutaryl-CoA dehydratase [Deltaproteobacteria bacterium]MBW2142340.1 2-hydroxyglutaryl-CoA dehydratase [Deltaproteobacteria bacterium]MBW2324339.1 2-hydroxyglutaryl-CoA dehydratase [Deltaproteobacteria bacterium]
MIVAGCDVGSLTAEAVVMDNGNILGSEIIRVRPKPEQSARDVMEKLLEKLDLVYDDINYCVSTGYGRETISFADSNLSEISCHGRGAHWLDPSVRTVIDVGGQDCKAIKVDGDGLLEDFVMNDKCAAGTGRSLELMSEALGVDVSQLGPLSLDSSEVITITNQCSIFAEMEIMHYLCEDRNIADIAAGINDAMARRVKLLVGKVGIKDRIGITGGVSKNIGVVKNLEQMLGKEFVEFQEDPQIIGALGAAVFAAERVKDLPQRQASR